MNQRDIGTRYEDLAKEYLLQNGYEIVEQNFRNRTGEIDIIAKKDGYLIFTEVKYRSGTHMGSPLEAVTKKKQSIIFQTARYYLLKSGYGENVPCRFDVIGITGTKIEHIENAFYRGF